MKLLLACSAFLLSILLCIAQNKPVQAGTYRMEHGGVLYEVILTPHKSGNFTVSGNAYAYSLKVPITGTLYARTGRLKAEARHSTRDVDINGHWSFNDGVLVINSRYYKKNLVAEKAGDFSGEWSTQHGAMKLTQSGIVVSGTYNYSGGTIKGTVKGNTLEFQWKQTNARAGRGVFILSKDGKSFSGTWEYTESTNPSDIGKGGTWSGSKIK